MGGSQTGWRHIYAKKTFVYFFFFIFRQTFVAAEQHPFVSHHAEPVSAEEHKERAQNRTNKHAREVESRELGASAALMC